MVASGGILSEGHGPGVCLGDGQTEAGGVASQGGRGDALLLAPILVLTYNRADGRFVSSCEFSTLHV